MTKENVKQFLDFSLTGMVEKKGGLDYLSWAHAWKIVLSIDPMANYKILPYKADNFGIMVFTECTLFGVTREMWLPVMDNRNKALTMAGANMFDINKTYMRCFVKNLAMFGLGLNLYTGEDLPEEIKELPKDDTEKKAVLESIKGFAEKMSEVDKEALRESCKGKDLSALKLILHDLTAKNVAKAQNVFSATREKLEQEIAETQKEIF